MSEKALTVKLKEKDLLKELEQYKGKEGYNLTLPPPGTIHLSPFVTYDISQVRIDARKVDAGGEIHDLRGTFMPAAPAIFRLSVAWGIQFDSAKSETKLIEPYHWSSKAVGKRRNPDGTWSEGYAEYEFDANLRGEELRMKMRGKSEFSIESMILDLKKYGRQRCVTGAQLALIHKLTGMKTGFKEIGELKANFIAYRFVNDVDAMMADPNMKQAAINQALGVKQDIYGPAEVRDVTPQEETEALPEPEAKVENDEDPGPDFDDIPFGEPVPREFTPEVEEARNWLLEISGLPDVPKDTQAWIKDFLNGKSDKDGTDIDTLKRIQKTIRKNVPALAGDMI